MGFEVLGNSLKTFEVLGIGSNTIEVLGNGFKTFEVLGIGSNSVELLASDSEINFLNSIISYYNHNNSRFEKCDYILVAIP